MTMKEDGLMGLHVVFASDEPYNECLCGVDR